MIYLWDIWQKFLYLFPIIHIWLSQPLLLSVPCLRWPPAHTMQREAPTRPHCQLCKEEMKDIESGATFHCLFLQHPWLHALPSLWSPIQHWQSRPAPALPVEQAMPEQNNFFIGMGLGGQYYKTSGNKNFTGPQTAAYLVSIKTGSVFSYVFFFSSCFQPFSLFFFFFFKYLGIH